MTTIIGGGIAGSYIAIKLSEKVKENEGNNKIILYEQNKLLSGNPYIHLHSGGILYPELTLEEEKEFIEDSKFFMEEFADCLIKKPTVVIYRQPYSPQDLVKKCQRISEKIGDFYQIYEKEDINFEKKRLKKGNKCLKCCCSELVSFHDQYVNEMLKYFNTYYLTFPFVSCLEYLIDQEKVREKLMTQILNIPNIEIRFEKYDLSKSESALIYDCTNNGPKKEHKGVFKFELLNLDLTKFPEIALIGKRGSDKPLIQITPIDKEIHIHILNNKGTLIDETSSNIFFNSFNFLNPFNEITRDDIKIDLRKDYVKKEIRKILPIFEKANFLEFYHGYQSFIDEKRTSSILENEEKEINKQLKTVVLVKAFSIVGLFRRNILKEKKKK